MDALLDPMKEQADAPLRSESPGLRLTPDDLKAYLDHLTQKGRKSGTLVTYRRSLDALYGDLPEDKTVWPGTLGQWRAELLEAGYSPRTVNTRLSVANGLVGFLGRRDLQAPEMLEVSGEQPELTRTEYLRLLSTARALDEERLYLLVKLFGSTGLALNDLSRLTVEALQGREPCPVRLPDFLRQELLDYAQRSGAAAGPLFHTREGKPMGRTAVTDSIKRLCRDAHVARKKVNPRCLKRLWQATQESVYAQIDRLVEQACDGLLEAEQRTIGWEANKEGT